MRKINAWLQWEHLPVIQRTKQGGFILNEQASVKLFTQKAEPESGYVYSHEERLQISILILLGMPDVTLNHFVSILEISKNTALSTLKQLQILIRRFNLELRYSREFGLPADRPSNLTAASCSAKHSTASSISWKVHALTAFSKSVRNRSRRWTGS